MISSRYYIAAASLVSVLAVTTQAQSGLQILAPAGGEVFFGGTPITVAWSAVQPVGYVDVVLRKAGQDFASLTAVPMSAGLASWELCPFLGDGKDYSIAVVGQDAAGGSIEAVSAAFTITGCLPRPTATFVQPLDGATVTPGAYPAPVIQWTTTVSSEQPIDIDLYQGGQFVRTVGRVPMSKGQVDWPYPYSLDGSDYSLRISTDGCGEEVVATSGTFSIQFTPPLPAVLPVVVTQPVAGTVWAAGTTQRITWTAEVNYGDAANLVLLKAGRRCAYIGTALATGSGNFCDWAICPELPAGIDYAIEVTRTNSKNTVVQSVSPEFTITSPVGPPAPIYLLQPTGGENWLAGGPATVAWQTDRTGGNLVAGLAIGGEWQMALGIAPLEAGMLNLTLPDNLRGDMYEVVLRSRTCGGVTSATSAPLLATPAPKNTVSIVQWRSVRTHSGIGDVAIILDPGGVSSPSGYAMPSPTVDARGTPAKSNDRRIEVVFDGPITLNNPAGVYVLGSVSNLQCSVESERVLTLRCTVPDAGCVKFTIGTGTLAQTVTGDLDCTVRFVAGDADGSGNVTLADLEWLKSRCFGQSARSYPQADFNLNGVIDLGDVSFAKYRSGGTIPACYY